MMQQRGDLFNIALLGSVLAVLFFGTSRRIGVIFLDELLKDDDSESLQALLTLVALPGPDGTLVIPTIHDQSRSALRGPSLAAIAFACIHVSEIVLFSQYSLNSSFEHADLPRVGTSQNPGHWCAETETKGEDQDQDKNACEGVPGTGLR
jgi:hypothetical protein